MARRRKYNIENVLRTAYELHKEGKLIHRWSVYYRMVENHDKYVTRDSVTQILKRYPKAVKKVSTLPNKGDGLAVYAWVGGDDYFKK